MMTLARSNARQVRTALSSEVWESVNEAWMDLKAALTRPVLDRNLYDTLALIRARTSVVRGALHGTMLRNDIFSFCRLGTFVERAESTARILDVKYYVLLPSAAFVGSAIDNAQWEVILSSVSAARSYRWINAGKTSPMGVAEFVILDQRMPRSLAFCAEKIGLYLNRLEKAYDRRQDSQALADHMRLRIEGSSIEAIFQNGLHEFLSDFIADTNRLSLLIEQDFRFYE